MTDTVLIIQTLGFTAGTILFGLLFVLTRKASRITGDGWHGSMAAAAAWLWNAGNLADYAAMLSGLPETSLPCRLAGAVAYSGTALLSTSLLYMQASRWERPWQSRASRAFRAFSYAMAVGLTIAFFVTAIAFPIRFSTFTILSAYNLPLHILACLTIFRNAGGRKTRTKAQGSYVRLMLLMLSGLAVMLIVLIHFGFDRAMDETLSVIAMQSSIPMALVSFVFLSRFRFADVFVKQSFTILVAMLAAGFHWLLVLLLTQWIRAGSNFPEAAAWIAGTLLWSALLLLFPAIRRAIHRGVDRWLFRRPDYRALARAFAIESEQAASQQQLFALAEERIRDALQIERVTVLPYREVPLPPAKDGSFFTQFQSGQIEEIEQFVPIKVSGVVAYQLAVAPGQGNRKLLSDEIDFLASLADQIGRRLEAVQFERERREHELHETRLRHSLTEAELRALQAQINPHFLFNTLNTIADRISSAPETAEAMTERLAEVFRYVLQRNGAGLISVAEEFDFLRTYLAIEEARFGDWLRVEMKMDPQATALRLPPLLLQPLVENAIRHGLAPKREGGRLRIQATVDHDTLRLTVEDDGIGWGNSPATNGHGIGLQNVRERLQLVYGDRARLEINSEAQAGTRIRITIPNA
jgi:two-component system LytT family sensor kinase